MVGVVVEAGRRMQYPVFFFFQNLTHRLKLL
jgi:hypothetical protein